MVRRSSRPFPIPQSCTDLSVETLGKTPATVHEELTVTALLLQLCVCVCVRGSETVELNSRFEFTDLFPVKHRHFSWLPPWLQPSPWWPLCRLPKTQRGIYLLTLAVAFSLLQLASPSAIASSATIAFEETLHSDEVFLSS